jgi:general transcription factor 3C polypeptide 3 (transcription factor C subunit 4)
MYEKAKEDEEALILAAEAMALQEAHDQPIGTHQSELASHRRRSQDGAGSRVRRQKVGGLSGRAPKRPVIPRRYRPKRLANPDKRRQEEQAHAIRLSRQYSAVCELKNQIRSGRDDLIDSWMRSSRELIDDFRSLKKFYSWDKYLNFLSSSKSPQPLSRYQPSSELSQMYERLTRSKTVPMTTSQYT